jgi:hypothetical protein
VTPSIDMKNVPDPQKQRDIPHVLAVRRAAPVRR